MKQVPLCQKGSFPLSLAEGTKGYLWGLSAYQNPCWPPGSLSTTSTRYTFPGPSPHPPTPVCPPYNPHGLPTLLVLSLLLSYLSPSLSPCSLAILCSLSLAILSGYLHYARLCSLKLSSGQPWPCPVCFLHSMLWTLPDASGCSLSLLFTIKTFPSNGVVTSTVSLLPSHLVQLHVW